MLRKLWLIMAAIAMLGVISVAPASATHDNPSTSTPKDDGPHENSPQPPVAAAENSCAVEGVVNIHDGVPAVPQALGKNHNHFKFTNLLIVCAGLNTNFLGAFDVEAAGGTDGPGECDAANVGKDPKCADHPAPSNHGEDISAGWSHSSCYSVLCTFTTKVSDLYHGTNENPPGSGECYNCAEIRATRISGESGSSCAAPIKDCANVLKFCRGLYDDRTPVGGTPTPTCMDPDGVGSTGGGNIHAWGALKDWTHAPGAVLCFRAILDAAPSANPDTPRTDGKINQIIVGGGAVTWQETRKAPCLGHKNP